MSITNIFTRKAPTISSLEFDAVLEDTLESEVTLTSYPIELGARAADHRIIQPKKVTMLVAIGNKKLTASVTDFIGAASFVDTDDGALAATLGYSAGFLAGSEETRASAALEKLLSIQATGEPFSVDVETGVSLTNMVIKRITRQRTPETEDALIAAVEMQELPTLTTVLSLNNPSLSQLNSNDPSYTQAGGSVDKGEVVGSTPSDSVTSAVGELL